MNIHTQNEALNLQIYIFKYCRFVKQNNGFGFTNIHLQNSILDGCKYVNRVS